MSTTWFTSDTHYGHKNILKHANRPFSSMEEMEEVFVDNWNRLVGKKDRVIHNGDVAFAGLEETRRIIGRLNGEKHLVKGNHDPDRINPLFASAQHYLEIKAGGQHIVLMHYAMRVWNRSHHGAIHLFGHSHGNAAPFGKSVDVGVDSPWITGRAEYRPFAVEEILDLMEIFEQESIDHH